MIPDNVLLRLFDFCSTDKNPYNWWRALVHVCRNWRQVIFASPRRLNLQLLCTRKTPVRKTLGFWPAIPIAVCDRFSIDPTDEDNIFAALECRNRIREVDLRLTSSQLEKVAMAMQVPFPALSLLQISPPTSPRWSGSPRNVLTLPDGFLGGNASSLQKISLTGISFPALPALLLSANNLISLHLGSVFYLHQGRWSQVWPQRQDSRTFSLNSPLWLSPSLKYLRHRHPELCFPLSPDSNSKAMKRS
jgi:hypothetical protein